MSQYSETIGSFTRTGDYPLEANYIFATEAELKEFYSDPINAATLHKGLLKIVEDDGDGKQALYWVVPSEDSLEFVKLIENVNIDNIGTQLEELSTKLDTEIQDRKDADTKIWGVDDYSTLPEDLNSLNDLQLALTALEESLGQGSTIEGYISEDHRTFYSDASKTLPIVAETGKIYIDLDTNLSYRYSSLDTIYVEIGALTLGETADTAYPGNKGKATTDSLNSHLSDYNNPHKVTAAQVGTFTEEEITEKLASKADLVDGKLVVDQFPDNFLEWIDL